MELCFVNASTWQCGQSSKEEPFQTLLRHVEPETEQIRLQRFYKFIDSKRSMIAYFLLKLLYCQSIPLSSIKFHRTPQNKPYLSSPLSPTTNFINVNASHAGDWVVVGKISQPLSSHIFIIGVDIEHSTFPKERTTCFQFLKSLQPNFSTKEWSLIIQDNTTESHFEYLSLEEEQQITDRLFIFWTLKEAFIKAIGKGFGFEVQRLEFEFSDTINLNRLEECIPTVCIDGKKQLNWKFKVMKWKEEYICSVALGPWFDPHMSTEYISAIIPTNVKIGQVDSDVICKLEEEALHECKCREISEEEWKKLLEEYCV